MDSPAPEAPISFTGELVYVEPLGDLKVVDEDVKIYDTEDYDEKIYYDQDKLQDEALDYHELVENEVRNTSGTVLVVFGSEEEGDKYVELPIQGVKSLEHGTTTVDQNKVLKSYELWAVLGDRDRVELKVEYPSASGLIGKMSVLVRFILPKVSIKTPPDSLENEIENKKFPEIDLDQVREAEDRQEEEMGYGENQEKPGLAVGQLLTDVKQDKVEYNALVYREVLED